MSLPWLLWSVALIVTGAATSVALFLWVFEALTNDHKD